MDDTTGRIIRAGADSMIGYLDSFWAFALAVLVVLPLVLLVRRKR